MMTNSLPTTAPAATEAPTTPANPYGRRCTVCSGPFAEFDTPVGPCCEDCAGEDLDQVEITAAEHTAYGRPEQYLTGTEAAQAPATVRCARCSTDVPADTVDELCPASNGTGPHLPAASPEETAASIARFGPLAPAERPMPRREPAGSDGC